MNKIILIGRLVRDPDSRYTNTGKHVCQFTLAVDRPFPNQDGQKEADFFPVVFWGKRGEILANSIAKGQRLLVEGRVQMRTYDDKEGKKRYVTEVIADNFEYLEPKSDASSSAQPSAQKAAPAAQANANGTMGNFGPSVNFDEEIPF